MEAICQLSRLQHLQLSLADARAAATATLHVPTALTRLTHLDVSGYPLGLEPIDVKLASSPFASGRTWLSHMPNLQARVPCAGLLH